MYHMNVQLCIFDGSSLVFLEEATFPTLQIDEH